MYFIIGAGGFLGSYFIEAIQENTDEGIIAFTKNGTEREEKGVRWDKCDITDESQILAINDKYKDIQKKVLFLAAYHHPDLVEKNRKYAWEVNVTALSKFINSLENVECLFYPSTDSVYGNGGLNKHFKEDDLLHPANEYGRQKAVAESIINGYGYNVVRYPFLIAPSKISKKHFYDVIVETISQGQEMEMFEDSFRSSLDFKTVTELTIEVMENFSEDLPKILNVSGDDDLSKYDIGLMIAKKHGIPYERIKPISVKGANHIFKAERAQSTLMDNSLLKQILGKKSIRIQI